MGNENCGGKGTSHVPFASGRLKSTSSGRTSTKAEEANSPAKKNTNTPKQQAENAPKLPKVIETPLSSMLETLGEMLDSKVTYDLTPFLPATAVQIRAQENDGTIPIISIPVTNIPSPLAGYISPERILDLKEHLCGPTPLPPPAPRRIEDGLDFAEGIYGPVVPPKNQSDTSKDTSKTNIVSKNGAEIWASWKRAYDLWNGFYIEGRINKTWLGSEYVRIQKATDAYEDCTSDEADIDGHKRWEAVRDEDGDEEYIENPHWVAAKEKRAKEQAMDVMSLGGGFFPMRMLKEFITPEDLKASGKGESDDWIDNLQNTVWRPRRAGEEKERPIIELDDDVDRSFGKQIAGGVQDETGFNGWIDGGVDCGRSPFPVLRTKIQYFKETPITNNLHRYSKHLTWDGVTSTLFNMPMNPLPVSKSPAEQDKVDLRLVTNQKAYGDYIRDPRAESYGWDHKGTFPIDIRRVFRKKPKKVESTNNVEDDFEGMEDVQYEEALRDLEGDDGNASKAIVELDDEFPLRPQRQMLQNDPWYVTEEQRLKRDVPARFQPPSAVKYNKEIMHPTDSPEKNDILPVNADAWKVEREKDSTWEAQYFITNLHGATLLVNGQQIQKGYVAGPLPAFAVIECGNGQVAFWWGVGGREHGGGHRTVAHEQFLAMMRQRPGWEDIAKPAGVVWREKIAERMEREKTGDDLEDDPFWRECKNIWESGKEVLNSEPKIGGIPKVWNSKPNTPALSFASSIHEFQYLVVKTEYQRIENELVRYSRGVIYPQGDAAWRGNNQIFKTDADTAADRAIEIWNRSKNILVLKQQNYTRDLKSSRERREKAENERLARERVKATAEFRKNQKAAIDPSGPNQKKRKHPGDITTADIQPVSEVEKRLDKACLEWMEEKRETENQIASRLAGKPISEHAAIRDQYQRERATLLAQEDKERIKANELRRANDQLLLPLRFGGFPLSQLVSRIQYISNAQKAASLAKRRRLPQSEEEKRRILGAHEKEMEKEREKEWNKAKEEADLKRRKGEFLDRQTQGWEDIRRKKEEEEQEARDKVERKRYKSDLEGIRAARLKNLAKMAQQQEDGVGVGGGRGPHGSGPTWGQPGGKATVSGQSGNKPGGTETTSRPFPKPNDETAEIDNQFLQAALTQSLQDQTTQKSPTYASLYATRLETLTNIAAASNMTPLAFTLSKGFPSIDAYLRSGLARLLDDYSNNPEDEPDDDDPNPNLTTAERDFLRHAKKDVAYAIRQGVKGVRKALGISEEEYLRTKGWKGSLREFIKHEQAKITREESFCLSNDAINRMEGWSEEVKEEMRRVHGERRRKLGGRILAMEEWDVRVRALKDKGGMGERVQGVVGEEEGMGDVRFVGLAF